VKAGWKLEALGEVCEIAPKKALAKKTLTDEQLVSFVPMDHLGILESHFTAQEERSLSSVYKGYTYFCDDDVIIAKITPCFENGKMGVVSGMTNGVGFGSSEFVPIRGTGKTIPKYLFYYLLRNDFRENGARVMTGAVGHKRVPKEYLENLPIPLPPLEEQKRIMSILDEAFEGLDRARENAEANLKSARELFEERRRTLVSNKTTGDPLTLKDVCINFEYGTSSKSSATGCTPVLRMGNLQDGEIDWTNLVYSNDAGEREKYMLHKGDVLFNRTNSQAHVGKTSIFDGKMPAIFAGYLIRVTPKKEKLTNEFLNHYLNSDIAREYGRSVMGKSVNQANISGSRLKTYPINLPELERQHEITLELDALKVKVQEMQALYRTKLQDISDLRQSLLQKAFAGELT